MFEALSARARAMGAAAARRAASRIADGVEIPGVTVTVEDERVVVAGRGLVRRWLRDPALRWIGRER
jgi:hypothetical protein